MSFNETSTAPAASYTLNNNPLNTVHGAPQDAKFLAYLSLCILSLGPYT